MLLQLNPTIPMDTPKGQADAHFLIDYGSEAQLLFVVFVRETGECWTFPGPQIRLEKNITGGIRVDESYHYKKQLLLVKQAELKLNYLMHCLERLKSCGDAMAQDDIEDAAYAVADQEIELALVKIDLEAMS
jgi:hypothetical protein